MRLLLTALLSLAVFGCTPDPLSVMTFNIRYDNPGDGPSAWPNRADWVAEVITRASPDVIGVQEAMAHQVRALSYSLPDYDWVGVGRDDGRDAGEFVPLFYRRARVELIEWRSLWLSERPDSAGSIGWDAAITRVTTLGLFRDRVTGDTLRIVNTHFDHRGVRARLESARLLASELSGDRATILMGDFNLVDTTQAYRTLTGAGFVDAWREAGSPDPSGTWTGFEAPFPDGDRIDYIFSRGLTGPVAYEALERTRDGRYVSDHRPVAARFGGD